MDNFKRPSMFTNIKEEQIDKMSWLAFNIPVDVVKTVDAISAVLRSNFMKCTTAFTGGCLQERPVKDYDIIVCLHGYYNGAIDRTKYIKELIDKSISGITVLLTPVKMESWDENDRFNNIKLETSDGHLIDLLVTDYSINEYISGYPLAMQQVACNFNKGNIYKSEAFTKFCNKPIIIGCHDRMYCSETRYNKVIEKYIEYYPDYEVKQVSMDRIPVDLTTPAIFKK